MWEIFSDCFLHTYRVSVTTDINIIFISYWSTYVGDLQ